MPRKRIIWQIFPPLFLVILLTLIGGAFFASRYILKTTLAAAENSLRVRAVLVAEQVSALLPARNYEQLADRCRALSRQAEARVTIILPDGLVLADSMAAPTRMDNHADREEVVAALAGRIGISRRLSKTMGRDLLYVAVPVLGETTSFALPPPVIGIVRLALPPTSLVAVLKDLSLRIVFGGTLMAILVTGVTFSVSRRISRPLEDMQAIAERFGQHDFQRMISVDGREVSREVAGLAAALNRMALDLSERIETVTRQKNELEAVFKSMVEAVIVIDTEECIEQVNDAARLILGLADRAIGRPMVESVRNADLLKLVREMRHSRTPVTRELVFGSGSNTQCHFHASATPRSDSQGQRSGALIVLNDVTRLRRLETMRREFVANVSHELKTPITSIKGFVETICDGSTSAPEDVERFLKIILKQANRLNAIIDDLLALSRIEQEEEHNEIELQVASLRSVLQNSLESSTLKAREKDISLDLDCPASLSLPMNCHLLEQAVTNLLINAIKYSDEHSEVRVRAWQEEDVLIEVIDTGCGIAREHLPRLFERFYRSDKARSRSLGGTGLGLAIVKHIVQAHGGTVGVESEPERGSTFSIRLPPA